MLIHIKNKFTGILPTVFSRDKNGILVFQILNVLFVQRACGRYINGHMVSHCEATDHALVLSLADLSVWCSACQAYVDHPKLFPYRNAAHHLKFGEPLPWSYGPIQPTLSMI